MIFAVITLFWLFLTIFFCQKDRRASSGSCPLPSSAPLSTMLKKARILLKIILKVYDIFVMNIFVRAITLSASSHGDLRRRPAAWVVDTRVILNVAAAGAGCG